MMRGGEADRPKAWQRHVEGGARRGARSNEAPAHQAKAAALPNQRRGL